MFRKRIVLVVAFLVLLVFFCTLQHLQSYLPAIEKLPKTNKDIEEAIYQELRRLPESYSRGTEQQNSAERFLSNIKQTARWELGSEQLEQLWAEANSWPSDSQLTNLSSPLMGRILYSLGHARITKADLDTRGTQLKILLTLMGEQECVFKPKWYPIEKNIEGPVYAGKDRYGSEIVGFYLSVLLDKPFTPASVERTISLKYDILPVATKRLLNTTSCATNTVAVTNNKKKSRRARGKTLENRDAINSTKFSSLTNNTSNNNNVICNGGTVVVSHADNAPSSNITAVNGGTNASVDTYSNCIGSDVLSKIAELKQTIKDKEILETAVEKLSNELKNSKSELSELRNQLIALQQQEKTFKHELLLSKTKLEQAESKWKQILKQNEHFKSVISSHEKRISELQTRKSELERDLVNERHNNAVYSKKEDFTKPHGHAENYGGHFKTKVFDLERELKSLRRELRNKDELNAKIEEDVKKLRLNSANKQSDEETYAKQIEFLHQKNYILEQTLSSENRLKQDLFRALNDSKAQIETLNVRLRCYEQRMDGGAMAPSGSCEMNGKYSGSLSDLHQQQQLSPRQLQSVPLSSISSYSTSVTPPSMTVASTLNLDQLMQATGAQHMSYSFAPFDAACSNGNGSDYLKNGNTNSMLDLGSMNGGGGAFDTFGEVSSSSGGGKQQKQSLLTIGSHRHSGCTSNNINSASSFPQQSLVNNNYHQQQQYHSSSENNKCAAPSSTNVNSSTTTAKSC